MSTLAITAFAHAAKEGGYRWHYEPARASGAQAQGWPWPWNDSSTSDCSYWFFDGEVWDAAGHPDQCWTEYYARCSAPEPERAEQFSALERIEFPDMSAVKNVTLGPRSGIMLIRAMD